MLGQMLTLPNFKAYAEHMPKKKAQKVGQSECLT